MSSYPEKEEKKKWKDLKLMKKLERQRAQEEQAKCQQEEEAAAQGEDRGEQLGPWAGQRMLYLEGTLESSGSRRLVLMERPRELSADLLLREGIMSQGLMPPDLILVTIVMFYLFF